MELFNSTISTFKLEYANSTLKLVTNFKFELGFSKSAPIIGNFNLSSEVQCRVRNSQKFIRSSHYSQKFITEVHQKFV